MKLKPILYGLVVEANLNRLLSKHYQDGFIIVTSYRGENDDNTNKNTFNQLKGIIRQAGYGFIPVFGGFIENQGLDNETEVFEPALIVPNHVIGSMNPTDTGSENLKELGIKLCNQFNQDAVLYKPMGNNEAYYLDKTGNTVMSFNGKTVNDLAQIYFTKLKRGKNQADRRFTFTYLQDSPKTVGEANGRYGEQFFNQK